MAHRILGIDLGAYSVKVVVATGGLRKASVSDFFELPLPPPLTATAAAGAETIVETTVETIEARGLRAVGELIKERGFEHDVPYVGLGGDALSMRILDFQFSGLKRSDLDKAVGAELEAQLPHELDDLLYDFDVVPRELPATDDRPASVVPGTRVLAAATTRDRIAALLALAGLHGVDPRAIVAAPAAYARAAQLLHPGPAAEPVVILDHGHVRTNVCVVKGGRTVYARTISRGGKHVTQAVARAWSLPFEEAERAKHSDGFVASRAEPATSEAWQRISDVLKMELTPLVRDLRQTLAACRAQGGVTPRRVILCGGGGRLRGIVPFLSEGLELPVQLVAAADATRLLGPALAARNVAPDGALLALGLALDGASGRALFDLRRGELAYRADYGFLRAKAGVLAAAALVIIAFAAGNAYAALYQLRKEETILAERLKAVTTEVLGAPATVAEIEEKIAPKKEESPLPKATAFDQLVSISKTLPPRAEVRLDVQELDIKKDKVLVKGTTDSRAAIDAIEKQLKLIECYSDVQRGKIVEDSSKEVSFTLTLNSKCM